MGALGGPTSNGATDPDPGGVLGNDGATGSSGACGTVFGLAGLKTGGGGGGTGFTNCASAGPAAKLKQASDPATKSAAKAILSVLVVAIATSFAPLRRRRYELIPPARQCSYHESPEPRQKFPALRRRNNRGDVMPILTRRALVAGSAATATAALVGADPAAAVAPLDEAATPGIYRYKIGAFELTALYDGIWYRPITDKFIRNAPFSEVEHALDRAFMPHDKLTTPFTTLIVNTGKKLILIDTGTGGQIAPSAGALRDNLAIAGIDPKAVDLIVISHFHPDHINGIKDKDNALIFPNAEIMVPEPEWAYWMDDANLNAAPADLKLTFRNQRRIFSDIAPQVTRFAPGREVSSGIVTLPAAGHTPGHTVFAIHSGAQSLLVLSDTAQHPAVFARHPEWQAAFDIDGAAAVATRKRLFDRACADRMLVTGYHFPFPACGHLIKTATGYEHVPVEWAPNL